MKKNGILNRDISSVLAKMGHTDTIAIADCGLPIPDHIPCIDLTIRQGMPSFIDVLDAVLEDMAVERLVLADEIKQNNEQINHYITKKNISISYMSHELFKQQLSNVKAIIRTGENTPYANVILQSDVIF
ncbi:D-ribose pyranase [Salipaludibacillus sp. HK11]|uniref:D-ribose pyranase n=1 Tax=Salipaludibacillus sp. HK11 TaxID=3394320 RepID=UPI0039FC7471